MSKVFKSICSKTGTTMRDHRMIGEGDHVLVGLSGGKDSIILLQVLAERLRALPFTFSLSAAHVEATGIGYRIDHESLSALCNDLEVPLYFREISPDIEKNPEKPACFICSWERRKALFSLTRELGCNLLALGHHRKDAVETMLLNMIYHASVSSLPYNLTLFDGRLRVIRPLLDLDERMLEDYAGEEGLDRIEKSCPHEDRTRRKDMRAILEQIEKLHGPGTYNMFRAMDNIFTEYLPRDPGSHNPKPTHETGNP